MGLEYIEINIPKNYKPVVNRYDRLVDLVRELIDLSREFLVYCRIKLSDINAEVIVHKGCLIDARIEIDDEVVHGVRAWAIIEDLCELSNVEAVIYRFKPLSIE